MTLMNCIERIPNKLKGIAEKWEERTNGLPKYKEIIFVASGSSYNSAFAAKNFLERECKLSVVLEYPNNFVNYHNLINLDALYIFISQGGKTKLVLQALEKAKEAGCKVCAMTAERDCVIANQADYWLDMGCGYEEYLYRTIGYSATVASCMMLGVALAVKNNQIKKEQADDITRDLKKVADNLEQIQKTTLVWYEKNRFSLLRRQGMMIAAAGDLWPIAQESDIKVMEMVPMMTKSYELEEFIHGPQNAFDDSIIFILYSHAGEDEGKVRKIAEFLKQEIGYCAVVGAVASEQDEKDMKLYSVGKYFFPLEFITFIQVIAFEMADDRGRDLSRGVNTLIAKYIQKTV